jgi:hypothetical protein
MILISFNAAGDRRQRGALIKFLYDSTLREREDKSFLDLERN